MYEPRNRNPRLEEWRKQEEAMNERQRRHATRRRVARGWLQNSREPETPKNAELLAALDTMTAQPELVFDIRPRLLVSDTAEEFDGVIARAESGEFVIESVQAGENNAQWVFKVRYPR